MKRVDQEFIITVQIVAKINKNKTDKNKLNLG
jgi:hypothetical protein